MFLSMFLPMLLPTPLPRRDSLGGDLSRLPQGPFVLGIRLTHLLFQLIQALVALIAYDGAAHNQTLRIEDFDLLEDDACGRQTELGGDLLLALKVETAVREGKGAGAGAL